MTFAQKYLEIVRKRGEANAELKKVYKIIKCKELYLMAYAKLYANKGALTPGIDPKDTIDGMSITRIDTIIKKLEQGTYHWSPVRRTYIEKKNNSKKVRPLGMPGWNDKLLAEVMRMVLEAYYEPQFRECSHGFRLNKGCHTALSEIGRTWTGVSWFIEGDIKGCFDNIDHELVINILQRKIKDERFLKLIRDMLKAGYMEDWIYHKTYSGTPQGGIVSPLLSNIVLHELDKFVEDTLIPKYTKGTARKRNPDYMRLMLRAEAARKKGNYKLNGELQKVCRRMPSQLSNDPDFRRLRYIRYADDTLLGFIGTKEEAREIKQELKDFLQSIKLDMSEEKTLITHAQTEKARFLSYEICTVWNNSRTAVHKNTRTKRRSVNGCIRFSVPNDVMNVWKQKVKTKDRIIHRKELMNQSEYDIISTFEIELQGLINYYTLAHDIYRKMSELRYLWKESLVKTLANKLKTKSTKIRQKFKMYTSDGREVIGLAIQRKGKKPLTAVFGKKPIERQKGNIVIKDEIATVFSNRNELITRLLADECELCGRQDEVEGHHIKKLKDLKKKYKSQKEPPKWVQKMIAMRRKTLFVCKKCHDEIHHGQYDGVKLA